MIWYSISILIDMSKRESRNTIIDKVAQYLHWLTIPKQEFGNMPVCPYLDTEMRNDMLYIDIWYPSDNSFMDLMESLSLIHI